jgi:hypothetical protein
MNLIHQFVASFLAAVAAEQLSRRRLTRTSTPAMRPLLRHHLVPQLLKPKIWLRGGHEGGNFR